MKHFSLVSFSFHYFAFPMASGEEVRKHYLVTALRSHLTFQNITGDEAKQIEQEIMAQVDVSSDMDSIAFNDFMRSFVPVMMDTITVHLQERAKAAAAERERQERERALELQREEAARLLREAEELAKKAAEAEQAAKAAAQSAGLDIPESAGPETPESSHRRKQPTPRRWRTGTRALREIRKMTTGVTWKNLIPKAPFRAIVREILNSIPNVDGEFVGWRIQVH